MKYIYIRYIVVYLVFGLGLKPVSASSPDHIDGPTFRLIARLGHVGTEAVEFDAATHLLLTADPDSFQIRDVRDLHSVLESVPINDEMTSIRISRNGGVVVAALATRAVLYPVGRNGDVRIVRFRRPLRNTRISSSGGWVAGVEDGDNPKGKDRIVVYNLKSGEVQMGRIADGVVEYLEFDASESSLISVEQIELHNRIVRYVNYSSNRDRFVPIRSNYDYRASSVDGLVPVSLSDKGDRVVIAHDTWFETVSSSGIRLADNKRTEGGALALLRSVAMSSKGDRVITGRGDQVRVWDAATGEPLKPSLNASIHRCVTNRDCTTVVGVYDRLGGNGRTTGLATGAWSVETGRQIAILGDSHGRVAMSDDGGLIAICPADDNAGVAVWARQ